MAIGVPAKNAINAWSVAGAGFLTQVICIFTLNAVGMTISYFAPDFGVSVTEAAIISSVYGITYGGFGMIWGVCADKIGVRKTLVICGCGSALFMPASSHRPIACRKLQVASFGRL